MRIYIAGPLSADTRDSIQANINIVMDIAIELINLGHVPFVPHLSQYIEDRSVEYHNQSIEYDTWIQLDLSWIDVCDALLIVDDSPGTRIEKHYAIKIGKPIYTSISELKNK